MDPSEQLVEKYLQELGLGEVVFEPDGNIPPDFSINKSIAVEVRRLNQNHESPDGSTQGLEEAALPLEQHLENFLPTLGPSQTGESWFVGIEFHRPMGPWKPIRTQIERQLRAFMLEPNRAQTTACSLGCCSACRDCHVTRDNLEPADDDAVICEISELRQVQSGIVASYCNL